MFLPGVQRCVEELKRLWQSEYNYDVFVCNDRILYSTKKDVKDFIAEHLKKLDDEQNPYKYQSVIVHVISHGGDEGKTFTTSDLKKVPIDEFIKFELIQADDKCRNVKVIFNHSCRGEDDYGDGRLGSGIHRGGKSEPKNDHDIDESDGNRGQCPPGLLDSNWAIISANLKTRPVTDSGKFTDCICDEFGRNANRCWLWRKSFRTLITRIRNNLKDKTHGGDISEINQTLLYEKIIFGKSREANVNHPGLDYDQQIEIKQDNMDINKYVAMNRAISNCDAGCQMTQTYIIEDGEVNFKRKV